MYAPASAGAWVLRPPFSYPQESALFLHEYCEPWIGTSTRTGAIEVPSPELNNYAQKFTCAPGQLRPTLPDTRGPSTLLREKSLEDNMTVRDLCEHFVAGYVPPACVVLLWAAGFSEGAHVGALVGHGALIGLLLGAVVPGIPAQTWARVWGPVAALLLILGMVAAAAVEAAAALALAAGAVLAAVAGCFEVLRYLVGG